MSKEKIKFVFSEEFVDQSLENLKKEKGYENFKKVIEALGKL